MAHGLVVGSCRAEQWRLQHYAMWCSASAQQRKKTRITTAIAIIENDRFTLALLFGHISAVTCSFSNRLFAQVFINVPFNICYCPI